MHSSDLMAKLPYMPKKTPVPVVPLELREACVIAAQEVIAEKGAENLSLRDVARKLGVSHQAPYKHSPSRDHLLAEVMRRCFQRFAEHLDARGQFDRPHDDLAALGRQYLSYAGAHPLEYRLMFDTQWPASAEHPELIKDAVHAYDILRKVLRRLHGESAAMSDRVDLDALFIWSTVHGMAGVLNGNCIDKLNLKRKVLEQAIEHAIAMVASGLSGTQA
jgi:AcrR family transcriptional regulator